jgi:septum formation topological specificity factor MinE
MKLTRRATRRVQLIVATRRAEKETPKLDFDKLMEAILPF